MCGNFPTATILINYVGEFPNCYIKTTQNYKIFKREFSIDRKWEIPYCLINTTSKTQLKNEQISSC